MLADPVAGREAEDDTAIEPALRSEVDVLDAGGLAKARDLEEPREAPVAAREALALQQERQAILEGEAREIRDAPLLFQGLRHAGQSEGVQQVERLLHQHDRSPAGEGEAAGDSASSSGSDVR